MSERASSKGPRRRRSWYRRRLRRQRTAGVVILVLAIVIAVWINAARFLPLPSFHASQILPDSFWGRGKFLPDSAWTPPPHQGTRRRYAARIPGVYPYSLVPGGVKTAGALKEVAARDGAVSRHFSHFDYSKAHLVRATEPMEVYVSYRIRDTVFWTRKKIRIPAGELLLTDGNITARAKCGNQISETAKPEVSNEEPEEAVLEQPVALEPLAPPFPSRLGPHLDLPAGQPIAPPLFAGQFFFPYVNFGGGQLPFCESKDGTLDKKCHPHHKKPNTPEPGTIFLIASGLAVIVWRYRSTRRATVPS